MEYINLRLMSFTLIKSLVISLKKKKKKEFCNLVVLFNFKGEEIKSKSTFHT